MLEFVVPAKDFKKAIRLILVGRGENARRDTADFVVIADTLELRSTGSSTQMDAHVFQAGFARVPVAMLGKIRKLASSFKLPRLWIWIEGGRFRMESFTFSSPDIELKPIGIRGADLPVNAGPLDTLALQKLYSAEELAESGLATRIMEAQKKAGRAIDNATYELRDYGVPREAVRDLVDAHIALHAKALKAATGG
ncbi:MAG: hypothetical protein ACRD2Y_10565 [Terriglobales bacterium]